MKQQQTPRTATTRWKNVRRKVIAQARREGMEHCPNCKVKLVWEGPRQAASAEVDHIIPHSQGGSDHPDNLTILCGHCNTRKGDGTHTRSKRTSAQRGGGNSISTGWISTLWTPPANYTPPQT